MGTHKIDLRAFYWPLWAKFIFTRFYADFRFDMTCSLGFMRTSNNLRVLRVVIFVVGVVLNWSPSSNFVIEARFLRSESDFRGTHSDHTWVPLKSI